MAWVLGETVAAAMHGAAAITATYQPLPAILTIRDAIATGSYLTDTLRLASGDMASLSSSPVRMEGELEIGGQEHFYLETQAALASIDESGAILVCTSTQSPSGTQDVVARVLGLPRHQVIVECPRMGGAFARRPRSGASSASSSSSSSGSSSSPSSS